MIELADHLLGIARIAAASSDDEGGNGFAYLFLAAGFLFYGAMFLRYRNTDKRHHHESETKAETANGRASDTFSRSLKRLTNKRMRGANNTSVRGSLNRMF